MKTNTTKNFMKNSNVLIWIKQYSTSLMKPVLILMLASFLWYYSKTSRRSNEDENVNQEVLIVKTDSLKQANVELDEKLFTYKKTIDSLQLLQSNTHQIITHLKQEQHETVQAIDDFSSDELYRFFANIRTTKTND